MPELLNIHHSNFKSIIWEISEPLDTLFNSIHLSNFEVEYYHHLKTDFRKKQWLAYRLALMYLHDKTHLPIDYQPNGKPFLIDHSFFISVSHSGNFAQAISSKDKKVGVDIEVNSDKAYRVRNKFMSLSEMQDTAGVIPEKWALYHWCAKEAMYKAMGLDGVLFASQMSVANFDVLKLTAKGTYNYKNNLVYFDLVFLNHQDFTSVMCFQCV